MVPLIRGNVYHLTHLDHLGSILDRGILSDRLSSDLATALIGHAHIKERRFRCEVPVGPQGVVADYVPFYFAPRSPMLYAISGGQVDTYSGSQDELVYLVTSTERIAASDRQYVFTDRNAVLTLAQFSDNLADYDELVDWSLMNQTYWQNTPSEPDRKERRMAEFLVHEVVPRELLLGIAVRNEIRQAQVRELLSSKGSDLAVEVRAGWYF